jgi:hypothetical protein
MNVTMHDGKDSTFQSVDYIYELYVDKTLLKVHQFLTGSNYRFKDSRFMRNVDIAPDIHPGVQKVDIENNIDQLIGKWEVYDFTVNINGVRNPETSLAYKDTIIGNTYTFEYDHSGGKYNKDCIIVFRDFIDGNRDSWSRVECKIQIVDDIIILLESDENDPNKFSNSFYIWVTEWQKRKNNTTNEDFDSFISYALSRTDVRPDILIETKRYMKKIE